MAIKAAFRIIAAALLCALSAGIALSHPHVAATVRSEIVFSKDGSIAGIRYAWTFDEYFSEFATQGLDKNGDGVLSRDELAELAKVNVETLQESDYFTFAKSGETKLEFGQPTDYWLEHKDKLLTLHFTLPVKSGAQKSGFSFDVYDPNYYVAFSFASENAVKLVDAPANCSLKMKLPETVATPQQNETLFNSLSRSGNLNEQIANSVVVQCK